ncbi:MAG TPA: hypothetical protein VNH18_19065 [Bryobacteraceae bacterium]|nr:hypothetical protein [Bryobacteraceae bacterium]
MSERWAKAAVVGAIASAVTGLIQILPQISTFFEALVRMVAVSGASAGIARALAAFLFTLPFSVSLSWIVFKWSDRQSLRKLKAVTARTAKAAAMCTDIKPAPSAVGEPGPINGPADLSVEFLRRPDTNPAILVRLHSSGTDDLYMCRIVVREGRSFDPIKRAYRQGIAFNAVALYIPQLPAGARSNFGSMVRVVDNQLELANDVAQNKLTWPAGDDSDHQDWKLFVTVSATGIESWDKEICISWTRSTRDLREYLP